MSKTEILVHPDLCKVWDALESAAPTVDWVDLAVMSTSERSNRQAPRIRRAIALMVAAALVLVVGTETLGVLAARRAIADGVVVLDQAVDFPIDIDEMAEPWAPQGLSDLSINAAGIFAHGQDGPWQLGAEGWSPIGLAADFIVDGETFRGDAYLIGQQWLESGDRNLIWRFDRPSQNWETVFSIGGDGSSTHLSDLVAVEDNLMATGYVELGKVAAWNTPDGSIWTPIEVEQSRESSFNDATSNQEARVIVGMEDRSLPLVERHYPAIWAIGSSDQLDSVDMPDLRSLGFGYLIGGFRLSDGLEHVLPFGNGFVAYTGYLQIWDGFHDGLLLEPREAWSSLVLLSEDGATWQPHVLSEFGIYTMVPFGEGLLAVAALPPPTNTEVLELDDGTTVTAAARPANRLYYSDDGLVWQPVADSPAFDKPLLTTDGAGGALVLDEYQAADDFAETTIVYGISPN